jgi:hypothetical protein
MTIRLLSSVSNVAVIEDAGYLGDCVVRSFVVRSGTGTRLASCNTEAEALAAKRAFEQVLLPRFTRDEAIAICKRHLSEEIDAKAFHPKLAAGMRAALEALSAAGVFSDDTRKVHYPTMADKLDAAGIK